MVNVELADMDWVKSAVFAVIFFIDCVWVQEFVIGFNVDSLALVSCTKTVSFGISKLDFSRATD